MRNSRVPLTASLLALALMPASVIASTPQSAEAYVTVGVKWPSTSITYRNLSAGAYSTASSAALLSWSNLTDVNLTSSSSSNWILGTYTAADGYAGLTSLTTSGNTITNAVSRANFNYCGSYSTSKKRWVYAHEIGHALGLNHPVTNPAPTNQVMAPGAGYYDVYLNNVPTSDDINGVNFIY